jgi:DNA repair protein RadA/Sms
MAKKSATVFVCQECGAHRPKWEGRCSECGAWHSFVEERPVDGKSGPKNWRRGWTVQSASNAPQGPSRFPSGLSELDRVLGGGFVRGSYTLVGGDPGIGKSTLLLQVAGALAAHDQKVLYVSAEESVEQTWMRGERLGVKSGGVEVFCESDVEVIADLARKSKPHLLIVDSIQTIFLSDVQSAPGSVSQIRESAAHLMSLAKNEGFAVVIVGHVTKDGSLAGPKVLEHMVDTVLYFDGDNHQDFRLLRAIKNRFGSTHELGVFRMTREGLVAVENPSEMLLQERSSERIGSAIMATVEGTRPLLCEVQALTVASPLSIPRRTSLGVDLNRIHLLSAVLERHCRLELYRHDIFVNVVGGLRLTEPAADAAVCLALISSYGRQEIPNDMICFGEVGLTGEVRGVSQIELRMNEAFRLGFRKFVIPKASLRTLSSWPEIKQVRILPIDNVSQIARALEGSPAKTPPQRHSPPSGKTRKADETASN